MTPAVSVITPTWQRHDLLLGRCIPSVQAQRYPEVEHIVVSDGPDPELRNKLATHYLGLYEQHLILFDELPEHDPQVAWGVRARLRAIEMARGDLICYVDDDNTLYPHHVERLVECFTDPGVGFAYSRTHIHAGGYSVGSDPPVYGGIDTGGIMHRRAMLDVATWRYEPGQVTIDWDIVERWMNAGVKWACVQEITNEHF